MEISSSTGSFASVANTAQQGINRAQLTMNVTADNIANMNTKGFIPDRVEFGQTESIQPAYSNMPSPYTGPSLTNPTQEFVNLIQGKQAYMANAKVFQRDQAAFQYFINSVA